MKTSFELAMERLNKAAPTVKMSDEQKKRLAELDSIYAAKIAERELIVTSELEKASEKQDWKTVEQLQKQLVSDRKSLTAERDEKKELARQGK